MFNYEQVLLLLLLLKYLLNLFRGDDILWNYIYTACCRKLKKSAQDRRSKKHATEQTIFEIYTFMGFP
jgi:hypothetical protein